MLFVFQLICRLWAWLTGWSYQYDVPEGIKKGVIIVLPHTSNWDFIAAMGGYHLLKFKLRYFGKKQLFRWPIKGLLEKTGCIAVDRVKKENWVKTTSSLFEKEDFFLAIAPEGTRSYVEHLRTGFYHIALAAKVPVILAKIDYKAKTAEIGPAYTLTGNIEEDFKVFRAYYKDVNPKHPENFNRNIFPKGNLITTDK